MIALGDGPALLLRDGVPALRVGGAELAADTVLRTGVWYGSSRTSWPRGRCRSR